MHFQLKNTLCHTTKHTRNHLVPVCTCSVFLFLFVDNGEMHQIYSDDFLLHVIRSHGSSIEDKLSESFV